MREITQAVLARSAAVNERLRPNRAAPKAYVAKRGCLVARVVDIRHPIDHVDLVLTPARSPQLIAALKRKYGGARVIVVELDDRDFEISLPGPVKRILRSGADAYVLADSMEELARKITPRRDQAGADSASIEARELGSSTTVDELIAAFLRESVEYSTRLRVDDHHRD